jgi:hypothetical protein
MPDLKALSTGTKILLAAGLLLLIDTFLAWQKVSAEINGVEIASATASAWHGFLGVFMGLALIALLVWVGLQVANVDLNLNLPLPERTVTMGLAGLVLVLAVLKNLIDDYSAWASYVGIVLAALVAVGAWMRMQEPEVATAGMAPPAASAPPPPAAPPPPEAPPPSPPPASSGPGA